MSDHSTSSERSARAQVIQPETAPNIVPEWLASMEFCHIGFEDGPGRLCDGSNHGWCPGGEYNGEAICPACSRPTCPRCAQLLALEDALEDS